MKFEVGDFVKWGYRYFKITMFVDTGSSKYIEAISYDNPHSYPYFFFPKEITHVTRQELHTLKIELAGNKI